MPAAQVMSNDGGTRTPRTPKSPTNARATREVDKRLREVLAERLAYAVNECATYDMQTRHNLGQPATAAVPAANGKQVRPLALHLLSDLLQAEHPPRSYHANHER